MHAPPAGIRRIAKLALPYAPIALVLAAFLCTRLLLRYFYVFPQRMEAFAARWGVAAGWVGMPYAEPSIIAACMRNAAYLLPLALPPVLLATRYRELAWSRLGWGSALRVLAGGLALLLAWLASGYSYNAFFGQGHALDRLIVVAAALGVFAHPVWVAVSVPLSLTVLSQFAFSVPSPSLTDLRLPLDLLALFLSFLLAAGAVQHSRRWAGERRIDVSAFLFLALCIVASSYFVPGLQKARISPHLLDWAFIDRLDYHAAATLARGWLGFLSAAERETFLRLLRAASVPLLLFTFALELSALVLLANRKAATAFLFAAAGLHVGVFLESGILFWKWIAAGLLVAFVLHRASRAEVERCFGRVPLLLSVPLIFFSESWLSPTPLGWYNTPLATHFQVEATGTSGERYPVPAGALSPYERLPYTDLHFLAPGKLLVRGSGTRDPRFVARLESAGLAGLAGLREAAGTTSYDPRKARSLGAFLGALGCGLNGRTGSGDRLRWVRPPGHIHTWTPPHAYRGQEPITELRVRFRATYYDGARLHTVQNRVVLRQPIRCVAPRVAGTKVTARRWR